MIDLDRASLDRILPSPLGPADWDDVMRRSRARQGRRRRRPVALAAAALVVVVGTASAFGTVRDFFLDRGFIGLPPLEATASAPESGELVISYVGPTLDGVKTLKTGVMVTGGGNTHVWVYADGRLIWFRQGVVFRQGVDLPEGANPLNLPEAANPLFTGYLEQRLTPEGVELMRSEIISTAVLGDDDPAVLLRLVGGSEGLPLFHSIRVRNGDRVVQVTRASDLDRLGARLAYPASWLPAGAWEDRTIRAYVASRYAVCWGGGPQQPIEPSRILTALPAPAEDLLRARGFDGYRPPHSSREFACSDVTTEDARTLDKALAAAGLEREGGAYSLGYRVTDPMLPDEGPVRPHIWFEPHLPHGEVLFCPACG